MLAVLFWNIQKKPLLHRVARIAAGRGVDIVLLTESGEQTNDELLAALNQVGQDFHCPIKQNDRFRVACKMPVSRFPEVFNDVSNRLSVHEYLTVDGRAMLIGQVHLPSPASWDLANRNTQAPSIADQVRYCESQRNNQQTVLIGDFNLSPFDDGMVSFHGFHALMTRELAVRKNQRVVLGEKQPTFFNPMWQFLRDGGKSPSGTLHYSKNAPIMHFWYTLDQVLIRPGIAETLDRVEILETDGVESLLNRNGRPKQKNGSDHLPLLIRLNW